jgi:aspartate/tyrosine/aromatic aminotransferase
MFESVPVAPSDPILGLSEAFAKDERPTKVNLAVGVFKDASGATPLLESVREAERRLLESTRTKSYKPIDGDPAYGRVVRELLFGKGSELTRGGFAATAHAPGGTGALRLAADYLAAVHGRPKVWMSHPTWVNHPKIFGSAGLECATYRYFDPATNARDGDGR